MCQVEDMDWQLNIQRHKKIEELRGGVSNTKQKRENVCKKCNGNEHTKDETGSEVGGRRPINR